MRLHTICYTQNAGEPNEWRLEQVALAPITLVVGKNASGKSRTLSLINSLALLLSGAEKTHFISAHYIAKFIDDGIEFTYELKIRDQAVVEERFSKDGTILLDRGDDGKGKIFAEKLNDRLAFQTPPQELAIVARQDSLQHSFFQPLHDWAEGVRFFRFGSEMGRNNLAIIKQDAPPLDPKKTQEVIAVFREGQRRFGEKFTETIISDMGRVGYDIEGISTQVPSIIRHNARPEGEIIALSVKEKDLSSNTEQVEMSQGMFRVLSIIIQLIYAQFAHHPSCILIDDIGEGLDFERSCSLIELVMEKERKSNVQVMMTTNDRFVMNKVPFDHWAILQRSGGTCRLYNYTK